MLDWRIFSKRIKFSDLFNKKEESTFVSQTGYPPEIENLSVEDAVIFLKDKIDEAGDLLNNAVTDQNVENFKKTVKQFIRYVVDNNFEVSKKHQKGFTSPINIFANYNTKIYPRSPRVQIDSINKKIDELTKGMLYNQRNNILILERANEIKGLIVDFLTN